MFVVCAVERVGDQVAIAIEASQLVEHRSLELVPVEAFAVASFAAEFLSAGAGVIEIDAAVAFGTHADVGALAASAADDAGEQEVGAIAAAQRQVIASFLEQRLRRLEDVVVDERFVQAGVASLIGRPEVLFLDELTTGIDPRSRIDLWQVIKDLVHAGTTVLLTTQYLDEADSLADRLAVIDRGRLISEGTPDELKDRLGGSVIQLSVPDDRQTATMEALRARNGDNPQLDKLQGRITIPAPLGVRSLQEAVRRLDAANIVPDDIALQKPTLDDVFLALTGRAPAAEEPGPAAPARRRLRIRR
jgi:hypothetical protein